LPRRADLAQLRQRLFVVALAGLREREVILLALAPPGIDERVHGDHR
jgi:hypothetical protein